MTDFIDVDIRDAEPDDVRAAFNDMVRALRAAGAAIEASLIVAGVSYTEADVSADDPDDDLAEDDPET